MSGYFQELTMLRYRLETSDDGDSTTLIVDGISGETVHIVCETEDLLQISLAMAAASTIWLTRDANKKGFGH